MEKLERFKDTLFSVEAIQEAINEFKNYFKGKYEPSTLSISREHEDWDYDEIEEFYFDYNKGFESVYMVVRFGKTPFNNLKYNVSVYDYLSEVTIEVPQREIIEKVSSVFKKYMPMCNIYKLQKKMTKPTIFIGHGTSKSWRDLKDHLHDKHRFEIEAYEADDRSSEYLFENVKEMVKKSSLAILILTKDDKMDNGNFRSRQNVIHELGFSHAKIGRKNTLIVLEEDVEWPSNIQGIDRFTFKKGNIKEIFGDIVAALETRTFDLQKTKVFDTKVD